MKASLPPHPSPLCRPHPPRTNVRPWYQDINCQTLCWLNPRNPNRQIWALEALYKMLVEHGRKDFLRWVAHQLRPPRSAGHRVHGGGVTPPPRPGPVQGGRTASGVLAVPAPGVPALSAAYCGELRMHFPTDTGVRFPGQAIKAHSCFTCRDTALLQFSAVQNCGTQERELYGTVFVRKRPQLSLRPPGHGLCAGSSFLHKTKLQCRWPWGSHLRAGGGGGGDHHGPEIARPGPQGQSRELVGKAESQADAVFRT